MAEGWVMKVEGELGPFWLSATGCGLAPRPEVANDWCLTNSRGMATPFRTKEGAERVAVVLKLLEPALSMRHMTAEPR